MVLEPNSAGDGVSERLPVLRGEDRGSRGGGEGEESAKDVRGEVSEFSAKRREESFRKEGD